MMRTLVAAVLVACPLPAMAQAIPPPPLRDLSTDRPDKTESPYTVDRGHVQVELDFAAYTRDLVGDIRTETVAITPVNLKLGIGRDTDVQLIVAPYLRQTVHDRRRDRRQAIDGFGDVTLRLKHNLWGNDGGATALAVMPFVTLPTSTGGVGSRVAEFGVIVPLAIELTDRVGMGLMTEVDWTEDADGAGRALAFINSATLAFTLTERLGLYTELFTERGPDWIVTGDVGFTYALSPDTQLDTGINLGITDAADDVAVFVGFSRRF